MNRSAKFPSLPTSKKPYNRAVARRIYSFIEVTYRDGHREAYAPDNRLVSDGLDLHVIKPDGSYYLLPLNRVVEIALREKAAA